MADLIVAWDPNPVVEQITGYAVYLDSNRMAPVVASPYTFLGIIPGVHTVEVAAIGPWGEGPKSDPVTTPISASKPVNVHITINVQVQV